MRTTIHWVNEELGKAAKQMAKDDMDNMSRFINKLVAREIERRQHARQLVDPPGEYTTEEAQC
jgi:hypothetical protein